MGQTTGGDTAGTTGADAPGTTTGPDIPIDDPDPDDTELRIETVDPGVGRAKGGDVISVIGNGFVEDGTGVFFGASAGQDVFVISSTRLTVTTPPGQPGLVDVTVSIPSLEVSAQLGAAFRYESDILIIGVDPPEGDVSGGDPVTLSGSGFSQGNTTILFGDKKAINVQVVDDQTLLLTTPSAAGPGPVDIYVQNDKGGAQLKGGFLYFEQPNVDTLVPAAGPVEGNSEVTIRGRGFQAGAVVRFGETEATKVTFLDGNTLLAVTPPGTAGPVNVTVETDYGFGGIVNGYTYLGVEPVVGVTVVAVQPASGSTEGGDVVNVTAYGLTSLEDTTVLFGGNAATVLEVNPTKLTVTVETPAGDTGAVEVTVSTSNGEGSLPGAFTYKKVLEVKALNPVSGPVAGGTAVEIFGTGFAQGASVRIGALPCADVKVLNDKTIECITPPGSPGGADVTVIVGQDKANLANGYFYESGTIELFVVDPDQGSQAGGTFIRLLGAGFEAPVTVTVGGAKASHVKVINSTLVTAKTPPGAIGVADVAIEVGGSIATLPESFTYFDPVALYGGTWGPSVEGAVNITVLDGGSGAPLPDAFVMLTVDPDTPHQGFSNQAGQVTFSGTDVLGEQMVSASKEGYASNSVIEFNATNITIYLIPIPPPSPGGPPPGATISGKLHGLGKYVVAPPGNCLNKPTSGTPGGECAPCEDAGDCGAANPTCTQVGSSGKYCTHACASDAECITGYSCLNVSGIDQPQCVPTPGQKQARCYFTMGAQLPQSEDPFIVNADGEYSFPTRLGELAVVCLGGIVEWGNPDNDSNFQAYAFGVKRHIFVQAGANPGHDVTLNHPLTREISIRVDDPPYDPVIGPNVSITQVYWDFGSDGMFFHRNFLDFEFMFGNQTNLHSIPSQPQDWTGDVYDVRFMILTGAINFDQTNPNSQDPSSLTVLRDLKEIETDHVLRLAAGQWESVSSGIKKTVFAMHGSSGTDIWAVGAGGAVLHNNGLSWGQSASGTKSDLYGVYAAAPGDVWAAGAVGAMLHFDGAIWTRVEIPNATNVTFRGLWGSGPSDIWAVAQSNQGYWHYDGVAWSKLTGAPALDARDIHGVSANDIWAVGRYGNIRHFDGTNWAAQSSGTIEHLFSVHAVSPTEVYAVGERGRILTFDGDVWTTMPSPTNRNLRAVFGMGSGDVYAVGDGTTLLHYDGAEWADQTLPTKVSYHALQALWGDATTGLAQALGTSEVLMGPLLQVPQDQVPGDLDVMQGFHVGFDVKPGIPAHYNLINIGIPTPFGVTPVWGITTDGDVFEFDLPDFANIEGTPGIAPGVTYLLQIQRGYKDDFTIDNYDNTDFAPRSWATDTTFFTK